MENNIEIFKNSEFGEVRTMLIDGDPWFVGKDVALALGYGEGKSLANAVANHVDGEDKGVTEMMTPGGKQQMVIINESGLYSLVLSSKLPTAKKFKHWVTSEVLPTIRKTGGYGMPKTFAEALRLAADQQEKLEAQQKLIEVQKPKAEYFDKLVDRNLLTNFRDTAKQIGIGQKELVDFLLDKKYVYRDAGGKLKPYIQYNDVLFKVKDFEHNGHTGNQTLITPKGKETFRLLLGAQYSIAKV